MLTRDEFRQHFPPELSSDDGPLWAYENHIKIHCQYFVSVKEIKNWDGDIYWKWCTQVLRGTTICYSFNENEQWWGFTESSDVAIWLLKWTP